MITTIVTRVLMVLKVLVGVRPAEVRFDEVDHRIAGWCAFEAADKIAGRFIPPTDSMDEDDQICREISELVFDAIKGYATHEAHHGPVFREQIRQEKIHRERLAEMDSEIPF
jgi:hypothetical protein